MGVRCLLLAVLFSVLCILRFVLSLVVWCVGCSLCCSLSCCSLLDVSGLSFAGRCLWFVVWLRLVVFLFVACCISFVVRCVLSVIGWCSVFGVRCLLLFEVCGFVRFLCCVLFVCVLLVVCC